jgi:hypothetical protein
VIVPPAHKLTAAAMIAGYCQIIAGAHARGITVFGASVAPFVRAMYWSVEGGSQRAAVNDWIRHGGEFNAVLDFDAAFRDPAKPTRMAAGKTMGDYLHGNNAGHNAVGNSIDLKLFC